MKSTLIVLTLAVLALLGLEVAARVAPAAVAVAPTRWEYRVETYSDFTWKMGFTGANKDGDEGWEIVFARRADGGTGMAYECILKRPKR